MNRQYINGNSSEKRRAKLEIIVDILRTIHEGVNSPTRIMGVANLSWAPLTVDYLPLMVREHLVLEKPVDKWADRKKKYEYYLAPKGEEVLRAYKVLDSLISGFHPKMVLKKNRRGL